MQKALENIVFKGTRPFLLKRRSGSARQPAQSFKNYILQGFLRTYSTNAYHILTITERPGVLMLLK